MVNPLNRCTKVIAKALQLQPYILPIWRNKEKKISVFLKFKKTSKTLRSPESGQIPLLVLAFGTQVVSTTDQCINYITRYLLQGSLQK